MKSLLGYGIERMSTSKRYNACKSKDVSLLVDAHALRIYQDQYYSLNNFLGILITHDSK